MNEPRKPESAEAMPDLSASFVQVGSDATHRLCVQGQSVAKTINDFDLKDSGITRVVPKTEMISLVDHAEQLLRVA